jgi:alkylation response protein AidB-like acyl-CoA dehydrogenase
VIGEAGKGHKIAIETLNGGRIRISALVVPNED